MIQKKQETREEEVARVRSYLASQAMRRTPAQLVEALREAHQQFLAAIAAVPGAAFRTIPKEGEWSAADVLAHVRSIAAFEERLALFEDRKNLKGSPPSSDPLSVDPLSSDGGPDFSNMPPNILAFDSRTGKNLWHYQLGVPIRSTAGTTYMVDGRQYLLVPSGSALTAFALPQRP